MITKFDDYVQTPVKRYLTTEKAYKLLASAQAPDYVTGTLLDWMFDLQLAVTDQDYETLTRSERAVVNRLFRDFETAIEEAK